MPHINLLPWREERRKRRQREFGIAALGAVFIMLGVLILVHMRFDSKINYQQSRNRLLEGQIAELDKKIKEIAALDQEKRQLLARMKIIEKLQRSRPEIVHLVDELVIAMPEGLYFDKVTQQSNKVGISGYAQSNARISSIMRQLAKSPWLENPKLLQIKADAKAAKDGVRLNHFSLQVTQRKPEQQNTQEKPS
jgi:type IV pilus assembly protein PilN